MAAIAVLRRYLKLESASGLALVAMAALAVAWASSGETYTAAWDHEIRGISARWIVNDVLMSVFFFVVGLELRRELTNGQLRGVRRALLPVLAAAGGMIVPALLYRAIAGGDAARGWGIPMATDIAFALGVLALAGKRIPDGVRVFLLSLAIIDDLGAVVVIGAAYSDGIVFEGLAYAAAGVGAIVLLHRLGARSWVWALAPAIVVWEGLHVAGVHPALAGVLVGLVVTPGELEDRLHPWVAFGVMPLFALANAGVDLHQLEVVDNADVVGGISLGLVAGKLVGVVGATALAVGLRLVKLPGELRWRDVVLVGLAAGIGFTMSLFVAQLAFAGDPAMYAAARAGVLIASVLAALLTVGYGRLIARSPA